MCPVSHVADTNGTVHSSMLCSYVLLVGLPGTSQRTHLQLPPPTLSFTTDEYIRIQSRGINLHTPQSAPLIGTEGGGSFSPSMAFVNITASLTGQSRT